MKRPSMLESAIHTATAAVIICGCFAAIAMLGPFYGREIFGLLLKGPFP